MLKRNLIANFLGQGWTALMGVLFVPLYIDYLGLEAYGLIGLFAMLQGWLVLLDMGMAPTLSREMARFTGGVYERFSIRDLLRSVEIIGAVIAVCTAVVIWAGSDWLAANWLRAEQLPIPVVARAFSIMGIISALRFIENIYRSSLIGLQRQVLFNVINSAMSALRGLGVIGVLAWVEPTIEAFFLWQGAVSILTTLLLAGSVYQSLSRAPGRGAFSLKTLRNISRYALGMVGITLLSILLTQIDKLILANRLALSEFGNYSLASLMAGILNMATGPVAQAFFPRFTELKAKDDLSALTLAYHQGAQIVAVLTGSTAITLIVYGQPLLEAWTKNVALASDTSPVLAVLALGTLLNCLMNIPYQMLLAYGQTRLPIRINTCMVFLLAPAMYWSTTTYGALGAAWVWVALNSTYVLLAMHFIHKEILAQEKWNWYGQDVFMPLAASSMAALVLKPLEPSGSSPLLIFLFVGFAFLTIMLGGMLASCHARALTKNVLASLSLWPRGDRPVAP